MKQIIAAVNQRTSPEQLTVFIFDSYRHILTDSAKVVYPPAKDGSIQIEVGRAQYLALREKVIKHYKRTMELQEQINMKSALVLCDHSEIEALHSSLSWRITNPMRWLGEKMRARVSGH